jgi:carboxypeptidase C (cathepsin A)
MYLASSLFSEARSNPANAPTSIYIGGGPGVSGLDGASGFPCNINQDSNSTTLNYLSWNTKVNMLYIDQPIGVGFSYISLVKGTTNLLNSQFSPLLDQDVETVLTNLTTVAATMSAPVTSTLVNTTQQVARTMWQFAQLWFQEYQDPQPCLCTARQS